MARGSCGRDPGLDTTGTAAADVGRSEGRRRAGASLRAGNTRPRTSRIQGHVPRDDPPQCRPALPPVHSGRCGAADHRHPPRSLAATPRSSQPRDPGLATPRPAPSNRSPLPSSYRPAHFLSRADWSASLCLAQSVTATETRLTAPDWRGRSGRRPRGASSESASPGDTPPAKLPGSRLPAASRDPALSSAAAVSCRRPTRSGTARPGPRPSAGRVHSARGRRHLSARGPRLPPRAPQGPLGAARAAGSGSGSAPARGSPRQPGSRGLDAAGSTWYAPPEVRCRGPLPARGGWGCC